MPSNPFQEPTLSICRVNARAIVVGDSDRLEGSPLLCCATLNGDAPAVLPQRAELILLQHVFHFQIALGSLKAAIN